MNWDEFEQALRIGLMMQLCIIMVLGIIIITKVVMMEVRLT